MQTGFSVDRSARPPEPEVSKAPRRLREGEKPKPELDAMGRRRTYTPFRALKELQRSSGDEYQPAEGLISDEIHFNRDRAESISSRVDIPLRIANPTTHPIPSAEERDLLQIVLGGKKKSLDTFLSTHDVNLNVRNPNNGETLLHRILAQRDTRMFKALIEHGADLNLTNDTGETVMIAAAKDKRVNEMRLLLESKADPNKATPNSGSTPLIISSGEGDDKIVKEILSHGRSLHLDVDVKRKNDGLNAIMLAALRGHTTVFKHLQDYGVDMAVKDNFGSNLLIMSAYNGHDEIVSNILNKSANMHGKGKAKETFDINEQNNHGHTALFIASLKNHPKTAHLLLENKADPNIGDAKGNTPLMAASCNAHSLDVAKILLQHNANPNAENAEGRTALMYAAELGKDDIARILLENKSGTKMRANPNAQQGESGITPLMWAMFATTGNPKKVIDLLLQHKANPNLQAMRGYTAPMISHEHSQIANYEALLAKGANFFLEDEKGHDAFMHLSHDGNPNIVKWLLQKGMNPNIQSSSGLSALMCSVRSGNADVVKMFLEHEANPNLQHDSGTTALMFSVLNEDVESLRMLLAHKADPNLANEDGMSALNLAVYANRPEHVEALLQHGAKTDFIDESGLSPLAFATITGKPEITKLLLQHQAKYHANDDEPIIADDDLDAMDSAELKLECFDQLRFAAQHAENYQDRLKALTLAALIMNRLPSNESYIVGRAINALSEDASKAATTEEKNQILQKQKELGAQLSRINRSASNASSELSVATGIGRRREAISQRTAAIVGFRNKVMQKLGGIFESFQKSTN